MGIGARAGARRQRVLGLQQRCSAEPEWSVRSQWRALQWAAVWVSGAGSTGDGSLAVPIVRVSVCGSCRRQQTSGSKRCRRADAERGACTAQQRTAGARYAYSGCFDAFFFGVLYSSRCALQVL